MNKIKWRHPLNDPRPERGQAIFYIDYHWKELPASFHILAGYYEEGGNIGSGYNPRVCENDEHGAGSAGMYWPEDTAELMDCNHVGAWVPVEEINIPDWLKTEQS